MADDPSQSVADPNVTDPNIIPSPESASASANRPVSTILADLPGEASAESGSPTEPKTPLADPATDYTIPPTVPDESTVATESASVVTSPPTVLDDSASQPSADSKTTVSTESSVATQSATVQTETQGEASPPPPPPVPEEIQATPPQSAPQITPTPTPDPTEGGSIQDFLSSDQPSKVQPEAPVNAPSPVASQAQEIPSQSAEIKPEPLEGTQEAPLADSDSQKTSFGDILEGTGDAPVSVTPVPVPIQPPSSPVSEPISSTPKTSFGDFIGKLSVEEPTINIEPIEPPKPIQPTQPPQSPLPAEAPAKVGISPLPPKLQIETVVEAKADFFSKRQQALQTRRKKRDDHLAKIIALISQKGKVFNRDIRDVLRVSQSTATNYLHSLVKDGKIKKEGKAKATIYSL